MEWKNSNELIQTLIRESQVIATLTAQEASLQFTKLGNSAFIKTVVDTIENSANISAGTAAEAYTAGEAAITGGATTTAANVTLIETAGGTLAAAGLLSVSVPIALGLITAATGYIIGHNAYMDNQEFFDSLTGPLMEYCADGTVNLIALVDSAGNTYFDSRVYDTVKNHLESYISNYSPTYQPNITISSTNTIKNISPTEAFNLMYNKFLQYSKMPAANYNDLQYNNQIINRFSEYINTNYSNQMCTFNMANTFIYYHTMISMSAVIYVPISPSTEFTYEIIRQNGSSSSYTYITPYEYFLKAKTAYHQIILSCIPEIVQSTDSYDFYSEIYNKYIKYVIKINWQGDMNANSCSKIFSEVIGTNQSAELAMSNFSLIEQSTLPQGVTKFIPNLSELLNPVKLISGFNSEGNPTYTPYYPVGIPVGDPLSLPEIDPLRNPTITTNPEVVTPFIPITQPYPNGAPALSPSTNPQNSPLPNPVPSTDTSSYPAPNPSVDPSVTPTTGGTNPTKLPSPSNEGTSPRPNMPIIPPLSSSENGLLHVYNPTNEQINSFGSWLWTTFSGDLIDTLAKIFNNPMDAVIGLHEIYITPTTANTTTIKAGFLDSGVPSKLVGNRYTEINCGSITVPEYWGNYLDYSPYTKTYCYLPFIGIVELSTDDIVGHGVNVTYKIDSFTGSCIAIITVAKTGYDSIVYQYPGNCAVEIPITSGIKGAMQSALIGAATSAIAVASGGGAVVATAALAGGAKSGLNSKNEVSHSGSFGSTYGAMGAKKPFIIVKRPNQKVVPGYNTNYGYPAHTMVLISACSGYLRAKEVDVISVTATEEEKKLIETMLKSGVFVS